MSDQAIPLSCFIIAKDEEDRIGMTIESVRGLASDILVVDSGSTDRTIAIAEALGARVLFREWDGFGPQKVFAEEACEHDWILTLDADEPISSALRTEIEDLLKTGRIADADYYWVRLATLFAFEEKPPWHAFRARRIKLYNRTKARFSDSLVHDDVLPGDGARAGKLSGEILHYSQRSLAQQTAKVNAYSDLQLRDLKVRGKRLPAYRIVTEFPLAFFKAYFHRRHCFYGLWGIVISILYAYSRFLRVAKAYEAERNQKSDAPYARVLSGRAGEKERSIKEEDPK
ncbi:MAG: glycosyltransferase family 2 protein [Pseudomonadota bacterium]